jgi:ABC-2 type transport system permease protein
MQMPITPTVVVAAKGTIVLFQSYYIVLMLTLPPLIGIGRAMNADTLYWIQVAISLLLIPIVPICYASVLAIVMTFAFRRLRNRDALTLFSYGASLLLAIAMMMMAMPTIMNIGNSQEDVFVGLVKQNMGAFVQMIRMFPNFRLLTRALSAAGISSVGMMLLFALTCLLSVVVFLLIAEPLYKRGIRVMNDGSGRKGVCGLSKPHFDNHFAECGNGNRRILLFYPLRKLPKRSGIYNTYNTDLDAVVAGSGVLKPNSIAYYQQWGRTIC